MSIDPTSILMNIDPATILMFLVLIIIVIINIAVFILYLFILFKTIYLPKKINFKGFIKTTFRFLTFGYLKIPDLLLNITNFFAVMGVIFLMAVLIFILINIVLLGPVNLAVFPYFSEPMKLAFLIIAVIYGIIKFFMYLKNIEGFEQYNNEYESTLKYTKLKNYDDKRLITLERNIPSNSKNIKVYKDSLKNKNKDIEHFEGYNVKQYSDAY